MTVTETRPAPSPVIPPKRRRRWWPLAVLLALVAGAAATALLIGRGEDRVDPPSPTTIALPKPEGPALDAAGSELVQLLQAGRSRTFHATYRATGETVEAGGELTIEVWRRAGDQRQDTALVMPDGSVVRTAGLVVGDRTIVCSQRPKQDWRCSETVTSDVDPDGVFGDARDQLKGVKVQGRADTVAGRAVRCFDFAAADGPGTFCVTPEGVPVRVAVAGREFLLTALSGEVRDDVFNPPARPMAASGGG